MRVDAHVHLWWPDRARYDWLAHAPRELRRTFSYDALEPLLERHAVEACVLVQASDTVAETHLLLAEARRRERIVGVVGWVPLDAPDAPELVRELAADPLLVGLRPMLQDLDDARWILRPTCAPGLDALERAGLVLDALVRPHQLGAIVELARRRPGLAIVLDHAGKPRVADGTRWPGLDAWRRDLTGLAEAPRAHCKLSGLVTEAGARRDPAALAPFVEHALATFGPRRVLWGSDWPPCTLAGGYGAWHAAALELLGGLDPAEHERVLGANAAAVYGLPRPSEKDRTRDPR